MGASASALAVLALALALIGCGAPESARPDVVLITIDGLRADHVGAWGYPLDTTPTLDALAARGVRFADCSAQATRTWPSMASFMTGAYPATTGLREHPRPLPEEPAPLAAHFARAGYRTAAVVANFQVGRAGGFDRGFARFQETWDDERPDSERRGWRRERAPLTEAARVTDRALAWLAETPPGEPFFLWVHYADPLGPHAPPESHATLFLSDHPFQPVPLERLPRAQLQRTPAGEPITDLGFYRAQYDREIRYADDEIGRLLDGVARPEREAPLVVVVSSHGEGLGEHGEYLSHGRLPYQPTVGVPAIVAREGVVPPGRVVERPVGLIDVSATVLDLAGLDVPGSFEGTSLAGLARGADGGPSHVFGESGADPGAPQRIVREGRWKLVAIESASDHQAMTGAPLELYDLEDDPRELANVASAHPEVVARLYQALSEWVDPEGSADAAAARLRALGYGPEGTEAAVDGPLAGVVLLVIDTLRADRLSIAGHERTTTPAIDALARRGVWFEQAVTGAPWTLPAMIGLMTGRNVTAAVFRDDRLRVSAAEALRAAGIRTASFTEAGFTSAHFGFDRGFDEHHEFATKVRLAGANAPETSGSEGIEDTFAAASAWLDGVGEDRFFLLVHTYEPHTPYLRSLHTEGLASGQLGRVLDQRDSNRIHLGELTLGETELTYLSALYDGGVSVADRHVGRLLGRLRDLGLAGRVAVVLTADHGEDLGGREPRHAADHGHSLYDELLRVPLVVYDPRDGYALDRVTSQVRLVDVMPTVVELFGLPPLPEADGRSLLPLMRGEETGDRVAFARVTRKGPERVAVRKDGFKLIREVEAGRLGPPELHRLSDDPGERTDRAAEEPERVAELQAELDAFLAELADEGALDFGLEREDMPDPLREQLRALGYIE